MTPGFKEVERILKEIQSEQSEIKETQQTQGDRLIRIEDQVKFTNGKVTKHSENIDQLYSFSNNHDRVLEHVGCAIEQFSDDIAGLKTCVGGVKTFKDRLGGMGSIVVIIISLAIAAIAVIFK